MEGIGKQKIFAGNGTQFRQGNQLIEVHELEDLNITKQKEDILTSGFRTCPSYNDIDNTDSPFRRLIGLDKEPPDNKSFFTSCDAIEENKIRAEETRESQNSYRPLFQPTHEKKKNKTTRKKDTGKNSQIIDPSREPNYIGNLPLEEIMKNFESNQETQKAKKLSKKKSVVTIRKNKEERINAEEEELDASIVNETENIPTIADRVVPNIVKNDKIEDYENDFQTFGYFSNEKNNNNEDLGKFITYKKTETINVEKSKNIRHEKSLEKEKKTTNIIQSSTKFVSKVSQEKKKFEQSAVNNDVVFTIKNPFFGKSTERLKGMTDTERKSLWTSPINLTELIRQDDKWKTVTAYKNQSNSMMLTLSELISERKKLFKQSRNAFSMEDLEFLTKYESKVRLQEAHQKKITKNTLINIPFEKPKSNINHQNQSHKKSNFKSGMITYSHRGG